MVNWLNQRVGHCALVRCNAWRVQFKKGWLHCYARALDSRSVEFFDCERPFRKPPAAVPKRNKKGGTTYTTSDVKDRKRAERVATVSGLCSFNHLAHSSLIEKHSVKFKTYWQPNPFGKTKNKWRTREWKSILPQGWWRCKSCWGKRALCHWYPRS